MTSEAELQVFDHETLVELLAEEAEALRLGRDELYKQVRPAVQGVYAKLAARPMPGLPPVTDSLRFKVHDHKNDGLYPEVDHSEDVIAIEFYEELEPAAGTTVPVLSYGTSGTRMHYGVSDEERQALEDFSDKNRQRAELMSWYLRNRDDRAISDAERMLLNAIELRVNNHVFPPVKPAAGPTAL